MKKIDVFVFGDSIAYGVGDDELGGWVNRLRLNLERLDKEDVISIFNLSVSGEISEEVLARFETECKSRYKKDKLTFIIFAVGINDTQIINGVERVPLMNYEKNMRTLLNKGTAITDYVYVVGLTSVDETKMAPVIWDPRKSYYNDRIASFDKKLETICNSLDIDYIGVHDYIIKNDLSDGLHLNCKGHIKLSNTVIERIIDKIKK